MQRVTKSYHRTSQGKLHLVDTFGKIPLADITLIEDPHEEERMDDPGNVHFLLINFKDLFETVICQALITVQSIKSR